MAHREKFARAEVHFDELRETTESFLSGKPYMPVPETKMKFPAGVLLAIHLHKNGELPDVLPAILGDTLFNLRAALDHLAFALSSRHSGDSLKPASVSFPILRDVSGFAPGGAGTRAVAQMHPDARAAIEALQPYHSAGDSSEHPLTLLNDLCNTDKHRHFVFTGSVAAGTRVRFTRRSRNVRIEWETPAFYGPFDDRTDVLKMLVRFTGPNPVIDMDTEFTTTLAFPDAGPAATQLVAPVIAGIRDFIRDSVFPALEPLLA